MSVDWAITTMAAATTVAKAIVLHTYTVPLPLYQPTLISTLGKYALFIVMLG